MRSRFCAAEKLRRVDDIAGALPQRLQNFPLAADGLVNGQLAVLGHRVQAAGLFVAAAE